MFDEQVLLTPREPKKLIEQQGQPTPMMCNKLNVYQLDEIPLQVDVSGELL